MKTSTLILLLLLVGGAAGCGSDSPPAPSNNPPPSPPAPLPVQLAVFSDPDSTFMTSDVRDVDDQIVRFDTANNALIWVASGQSFAGFRVNGLSLSSSFQVRFGTVDGERRAYFTETGPATICDIEVVNGQLVISATNVRVPGGS